MTEVVIANNNAAVVKVTKEIIRKLKLVSALRGNAETQGTLIGSLLDKEIKRFGMKGNNDEE